MEFLKLMNDIKTKGYGTPLIQRMDTKKNPEWQILQEAVKILCIRESIVIELENGIDYPVGKDETFDIKANTFFRISSPHKNAVFFIAIQSIPMIGL